MKYNKGLIHNFLLISGLFLIILRGFSLLAVPTAKNLSIRYGTTPRINRYSWAILSCTLENPDSKKADIDIRLVDNITGVYKQNTIFSDLITIPSKTRIYYQTLAMVENSEEYNLELFHKEKQIGKTTSALIKLTSRKSKLIPIFNDSLDTDLGSFIQIKAFKNLYLPTFFSAKTPFNQWQLLINSPFIIMVRPNYSQFSTAKFQAIIAYVKQGGSIIFADPIGLKDAIKTPLAQLLPIKPLKIRKVTQLPAMRQIIPSFKTFSMPVNFLESIPNGDGITLLSSGEFPLIRYKKFGMGNVRAIAVPALSNVYNSRSEWEKLISYLFSHQSLIENNTIAKAVLDEMTGFTIPGIESVRWIIFLYFFIIALPLSIGIYFRKTGIAWITGGVLAILFAVVLLHTALSGAGIHKKDFLSFIEIVNKQDGFTSGIGYYGIMAASDKTINIEAEYDNVTFSTIPPSQTAMLFMSNSSKKQPPIEIKTVNGRPKINTLNLPVNSPRHFYSTFLKQNNNKNSFKLPELNRNGSEISLQPWKIPKGFATPEAAWLQFPSGTIDLIIKDRTVSIKKGTGVFQSNIINKSIKKFTSQGFKHSAPILFLLEDSKKASLFSLKNTIIHGKKITTVPVSQIFSSKKIIIHPKEISLTSGDTSTRLVMTGNELNPAIYSRATSTYLFKFQLPSYMTEIKPEQIECIFSYINDSNNIIIKPFLMGKTHYTKVKLPPKRAPRRRGNKNRKNKSKTMPRKTVAATYKTVAEREILKGVKDKNGVFIFSDLDGVIDSNTSSGFIGLEVDVKNKNIPLGAQKKTNTWRVEKFQIRIKGTLPEFKEKFTY